MAEAEGLGCRTCMPTEELIEVRRLIEVQREGNFLDGEVAVAEVALSLEEAALIEVGLGCHTEGLTHGGGYSWVHLLEDLSV